MMEVTDKDLSQLRNLKIEAQDVVSGLAPDDFSDAVHWDGVQVTSVEHAVDEEGTSTLRIWIEEAAPDAWCFRAAVQTRLLAGGWKHVEVITEW